MHLSKYKKRGVIAAIVLLAVAGLATAAYLTLYDKPTTPPAVTNVVELVGRHFVLPDDEEPAILTVVNKGDVSSAFLKGKVENGDKVLIYQTNKKVIIYRPSLDKVVDAGPAVIDDVETKDQ